MDSTKIPEIREIIFSFHGDFKRFLSNDRQKKGFTYRVKGRPTIKDTIEALGGSAHGSGCDHGQRSAC